MIDPINNNIGPIKSTGPTPPSAPGGGAESTGGANFADALRKSIDEVSKMQEDARKAVEDLSTGKTDDVSGVMTAMEKSDLAFKTLLAIRSKLMEAYDEIKTMQV